MIEIILVIVVVVVLFLLTVIMIQQRDRNTTQDKTNNSVMQQQETSTPDFTPTRTVKPLANSSRVNVFEEIIHLIKNRFEPASFENDEDCEKQLITFLTANLPSNVITRGHTTTGERIDIVIDGTYALELIIANNEEKLMYLMNLSMQSKKDFDNTAAVIIDIGVMPFSKLQEFADEIKKIGIETIIIQVNPELKMEINGDETETVSLSSD